MKLIFHSGVVLLFVWLNAGLSKSTYASGPETLLPGSFIVNTGIVPQTFNNGLKPYGLVFDLVRNYQVPIKWSIEPSKAKDSADFVYNSVSYRGGPFVVPAEYITPAVAARISYWISQGVVGVYTTSPMTIPVHSTITYFPIIMIDTLSNLQAIITNYYALSGIGAEGYSLGAPAGLNECFDIWTNPHGDPNWTTHGPLYNFVTQIKGWIWGQCHAVSMLEDVINPAPPNEQLNFLSQNGLRCWQSGSCGPGISEYHALTAIAPFTNNYPADPEMQFMLNLNLATQSGSERWYHPLSTGGWRPETKVGVSTATGAGSQQGVLAVYGFAYGDSSNGKVMYVSGHDLTSGGGGVAIQHKVSAIRTYFNFMLQAGKARQLSTLSTLPIDTMSSGTTQTVSVTVTSGTPQFTFEWTSDYGGAFENPDSASTVYYAPSTTVDTFDIVRIKVTDLCGRVNFLARRILILGVSVPLPVSLLSFHAAAVSSGVEVSWSTATEINNDYFTLERASENLQFESVYTVNGAGNSNQVRNYDWLDTNPFQGLNYYRLTQTDFDGTSKTFLPICIRAAGKVAALTIHDVYPNPFTHGFSLSYHSPEKSPALLEICSGRGKPVYSELLEAVRGTNFYQYAGRESLSDGVYFITLTQGDGSRATRMLIKK